MKQSLKNLQLSSLLKAFPGAILLLLFGWLALPSGLQGLGNVATWLEPVALVTNREANALERKHFPYARILRHIKSSIPNSDKILVYRQAELAYYAPEKQWVYDFDPRLEPLYAMSSDADAHAFLWSLGVRYVFIPNYMPATLYNSIAQKLLSNPALASQIAIDRGARLLMLHPAARPWECVGGAPGAWSVFQGGSMVVASENAQPFAPNLLTGSASYASHFTAGHDSWLRGGALRVHGATLLTAHERDRAGLRTTDPAAIDAGGVRFIWQRKDRNRLILSTEDTGLTLPPRWEKPPGTEAVTLEFALTGEGFVIVEMHEYDDIGAVRLRVVWDAILTRRNGTKVVRVTERLRENTKHVRFVIGPNGMQAGNIVTAGRAACYVRYLDQSPLAVVPTPRNDETRDSPARLPTVGSDEQIVQTWNFADPATWDGIKIPLGQWCGIASALCNFLGREHTEFVYFVQEGDDRRGRRGAFLMGQPLLTTDRLGFGPRSYIDLWASRRKWVYDRITYELKFWDELMASVHLWALGHSPSSNRRHRLDLEWGGEGTRIVDVILHYTDPRGWRRAYYLGPKGLFGGEEKASWHVTLPTEASNPVVELIRADDFRATYRPLHIRQIKLTRLPGDR